jgi:hypothetical protein
MKLTLELLELLAVYLVMFAVVIGFPLLLAVGCKSLLS